MRLIETIRETIRTLATTGIPFYVTRKSAGGEVATWSVNALLGLTIILVVSLNLILWGGIGVYEAVRFI